MEESLVLEYLADLEADYFGAVYLLQMYGIRGLLEDFQTWLVTKQYLQKQQEAYLDWNDIVNQFINKEN